MRSVKDQSFLLFILVSEAYLKVKLFLVKDFYLEVQEWLDQAELLSSGILRQLKLRVRICDIDIALD